MRRLLRFGPLLSAMALLAACGGGGLSLGDALSRMVLQPDDLPAGFVQAEEKFTSNEELAADSADPEARLEMLESWGRLQGFDAAFRPSETPVELPLQGINVSSSLYETEQGAGESFEDAVETAEETDWQANYSGLRKFKQQEVEADGLAEEIVWLRLSGFQPAASGSDTLVTDDLIFFREGRERGFLRVLAGTTESEDRAHYRSTVEGWLRALVGRVRDVLAELQEEG